VAYQTTTFMQEGTSALPTMTYADNSWQLMISDQLVQACTPQFQNATHITQFKRATLPGRQCSQTMFTQQLGLKLLQLLLPAIWL
jgi:hypothetical protein